MSAHKGLVDIVYIQFNINGSTGPENRYFHKLYYPKRTNVTTQHTTQIRLHFGSAPTVERVNLFQWEGMKLQHHPIPNLLRQPAVQLKVLTLMFKLLTFPTPAEVCPDPCASAQCPWLGSDHMPQMSGAWVYLWSKVCQQSSSCCVKLLVNFTYQAISECGYEKWHALGSDTDMGVTDVRMCLVCVCL